MKHSMTGGRMIRLLHSRGYVVMDHSQKPPLAVLHLSRLKRDRVTANDFLSWCANDKQGRMFRAIETDLVDLNEKLMEHGMAPLRYVVESKNMEQVAKGILDNFGKKVEVR